MANQSRRFCAPQRSRLDELALEQVEAIRLQVVENVLKIIYVPRLREFQRVEGLDEHPVGTCCRGRMLCPVTSVENAKISSVFLSLNRQITILPPWLEAHRVPQSTIATKMCPASPLAADFDGNLRMVNDAQPSRRAKSLCPCQARFGTSGTGRVIGMHDAA